MPLPSAQLDFLRECSKDEAAFQKLCAEFERLSPPSSLSLSPPPAVSADGRLATHPDHFFRMLLEHLPDMISWRNLDAKLAYISPAIHALLGYTPDEAAVYSVELIHPDDVKITRQLFEVTDPNIPIIRRHRVRHRDGHYVWFETVAQAVQDPATQEVIGFLSTTRDYSWQQQMIERLRASEEKFAKAFHANPAPMVITDLVTSQFMDVNASFMRLMGLTQEEIIGHTATELGLLATSEALAARADILETARQQGTVHLKDIELTTRDGQTKIVAVNAEKIEIQGQPCLLSMLFDMTEREAAKAALAQAHADYVDMAVNIPAVVFRFHILPDGQWINDYMSPRSTEILGMAPDDPRWTDPDSIKRVHPDDYPSSQSLLVESALNQTPYLWEGRFWVRDEWRHIRIQGNPRKLDDGSMMWNGIFIDVQKEKDLEQAKIQQAALEVALQKERELSDLKLRMMTRIAHEFRTPLAIISASGDLLIHHFDKLTPEKRERHLNSISTQMRQLSDLLSGISLVVTGLGTPLRQKMEWVGVLRQIIEKMTTESAPITFTPLLNECRLEADVERLGQLVEQLLENAKKFSAPGQPIEMHLAAEQAGFCLKIQDAGIGILSEELPHVTEPFFRGSNFDERPGIGIGLTIAQRIAEIHGGTWRLRVRSGWVRRYRFGCRVRPLLENDEMKQASYALPIA